MKPSVFYGGAPHDQNEDEDPDISSTGDEWDPNISEDDCSDNSEENLSVHNSETISDCQEGLAMSLITGVIGEELLPGPRRSDVGGKRTNHALVEAAGPKLKTRNRCRSCYEVIANNEGSSVARKKARRVNTFCDTCEGKPFLCVSCFSLKHSS